MRSTRMDDTSRVAKIEREQERGAVVSRKKQNAQCTNTRDFQDEMDRVNRPNKMVKEELEH